MEMDISVEDLPDGLTKAILRGRLDTTGAIAIELPFNALASERQALLIDLSGVGFMSSYGIRILLKGAKVIERKGGKLAIYCPQQAISKVLHTAGVSNLIPVYSVLHSAIVALR